jgi:hypothetical protein
VRRALVALLLLAAPALAEPVAEVGFVESFEGDAADYELERGDARLGVAVLTPLQAGDRVSVRSAGGRIVLRLSGDRAATVTRAESPYPVAGDASGASVLGNVARWVASWSEGEAEAQGVSLVARGSGALAAPLLDPPVQRMAARDGPLCVAWLGGEPPFELSLHESSARAPGARLELSELHARLDARLAPERSPLRLRLRDAIGAERSAEIEVLPHAPEPPPALAEAALDPMVRSVLAAAWLAGAEDGRWKLESYQRLCALAPDYAPARALADALERGRQPGSPLELPSR